MRVDKGEHGPVRAWALGDRAMGQQRNEAEAVCYELVG